MDLCAFKDKRICVAVSGGVDSTALLHYMCASRETYGFLLSAVHCQHGIRGEDALADMRFVQTLCERWGVPLYVYHENCPLKAEKEKCSLETAARNFRLAAFAEIVETGKADFIATAHHALDGAETVLFRIARGCSLTGAKGILEQNGYLIRPFLGWSKADIIAYAEKNALSYCVDKTNFETDATRNKLRLQVFPLLEQAVPNAAENMLRFATLAAEDDEYLYRLSEKLLVRSDEAGRGRAIIAFSDEKPLFCRACLSAMKYLGVEYDYTQAHIQSVFKLQKAERGARLDLPKNVRAEKTLSGIEMYVFSGEDEEDFCPPVTEKKFDGNGFDGGRYAVNVALGGNVPLKNAMVLRVDADKLPANAVYRFRREGDYIERFGGGTKTLKKFFNEKKIPPKDRAAIPLIAEDTGEVFVVCGWEISEKVKVDETTKRVYYISVDKN